MEVANHDLQDPAVCLYRCNWTIPVNVPVDTAIEAHKLALKDGAEPRTTHALRAIILAAPKDVPAIQRQFDYLAGLPSSAWKHYGGSDMRELTLRMVTRSIRWRQEA